ncbi:MAG: N-formylglutamate amidohydrolase [Sphingomonadaceae bacterium]
MTQQEKGRSKAGMNKRQIAAHDSAIQGGIIPGSGEPAWTLIRRTGLPIPVIIAAPHGGRAYPDAVLHNMRRAQPSMLRLEDRYIDLVAQAVMRRTGAVLLEAHAPRAILDLNRAEDDLDQGMIKGRIEKGGVHSLANRRARNGLGLIPRRLSGIGEIWKSRIPLDELQARIEGIHIPYHNVLSQILEELRDRWGAALLIDLHSMPPLAKKTPDDIPPQFVVGDRFGASCDAGLVARALRSFAARGWLTAHNRPYAGGYVLDRHANSSRGIFALQLEVCRSLYLDHRLAEPGEGMEEIADLISGLVRELAGEVAALGRDSGLSLAAE